MSPSAYRRDLRIARERALRGEELTMTPAGPLAFESGGEHGVVALVIHGAGGGHDMGGAMASMLLPPAQRWIAPSRFGYLNSPVLGDGSPAAQADAFAALLDHLGISRVVVVAFSMGGPSALQFAVRHAHRCAGLALLEALSHYTPGRSEWVDLGFRGLFHSNLIFWLATRLNRSMLLTLMGMSSAVHARLTPEEKRWMETYLQTMWPTELRKAGLLNDMARRPFPQGYTPRQIRVPTLVVHAMEDSLIAYENGQWAAAHIPGARLVTLPTGGHFMAGHHDLVRAELRALLEPAALPVRAHARS